MFADSRRWHGIPNAADVLSNLGFVLVGCLGLWRLAKMPAWLGKKGYYLFFAAVLLTGAGSGYYHWSPDNIRLVWDRLPIALACAGLLAANWQGASGASRGNLGLWSALAVASVGYWYGTDLIGAGDLRPYLWLQLLPLLLIPTLQYTYGANPQSRQVYAVAILFYILAKGGELADHTVFEYLHGLSGHTLKHVLATLVALVLAYRVDVLQTAWTLVSSQTRANDLWQYHKIDEITPN
ncbi:hypothetical protein [Chitinimonas naiadis]